MSELSFSIPCNGTLLPTRADLANIFIQIAHIPSQLEVIAQQIIREAEDAAAEEVLRRIQPLLEKAEQVRKILKTIERALGNYPISASSPFYKSLSIPEDEWERRMAALTQEFHLFVQAKILEIISSIIPLSFEIPIPILNITVDIVQLLGNASYRAALKADIADRVDYFQNLLPNAYKTFQGEYGVKSKEIAAQGVWNYIMSMLQKGAVNLIWQLMGALIKKFKTIWDALGLPPLPVLLDLGVEGIIEAVIASFRAELENAIAEEKMKIYRKIIEALEKINILGFSLVDLLGGPIYDFVDSPERSINRMVEAARDFGEQWPEYLLKLWIQKITAFLNAIGLSALLEWLTFDFCKFLKLIGMPTSISIDIGNISIPVNIIGNISIPSPLEANFVNPYE
jgi:DNA-binding ferritin-like protein (Dps family)